MTESLACQRVGSLLQIETPSRFVEDASAWREACREARVLGFHAMLMPRLWRQGERGAPDDPDQCVVNAARCDTMTHALSGLATICTEEDISFFMDVVLDGEVDDWVVRLTQWLQAGVSGFRCKGLASLPAADWQRLIAEVRLAVPGSRFMAWTPGLTAEQVLALRGVGFDTTFSSLPWWDYRAQWLAEEHARLSSVAPVVAPLCLDGLVGLQSNDELSLAAWRTSLWTAAIVGNGVLVSSSFAHAGSGAEIQAMNQWLSTRSEEGEPLLVLTGPLSACTAVFRGGAGLLLNPSPNAVAPVNWPLITARLPDCYSHLRLSTDLAQTSLAPAECQRFRAERTALISLDTTSASKKRELGLGLMSAPRIAIERVEPSVDDGRFAVKTTLGQLVNVEATVFMDGHAQLAVRLAWRAADESDWHETDMQPVGNDRWHATFIPLRLGRYEFVVKAWHDIWESYRVGLRKRHEAGADIDLDCREGQLLISDAVRRAQSETADAVSLLENTLDSGDVETLLSDAVALAMARLDPRPYETISDSAYPVMVERREASFSAWYELFPRSQSSVSGTHGTFGDVHKRLPAIRDMGFDVLYFPPIHPIGTTHRKGPNNALAAAVDDPGSPYAIGSEAGGHTAIHPQLGTLEEFQALVRDARRHGLEIALDFAIQCSPDHPWLKEHPKWFSRRADGTLRHAENPPKRYEDIVNPEFYQGMPQPTARASLWRALRDVLLFWIDKGIRIFRVDNPHTKPLPFWEWVLGEIHTRHPDVIFLSEAFTRPSMMCRLAKLGFSQSYTYFTWRNDKHELTSYLEELAGAPAALSFRPNFFVNTPDINPYFLQSSGRAGFLIRAALAATLSGSWGMYNGFELCEAQALPGREEYLDSEKYQLRAWDWNQPGNIIADITQLNRIRRSNPALQTHLGLRFHPVHDDSVLFFSKSTPEGDSVVLVLISLDPQAARGAWLELPLWMWGLEDNAQLLLEDASTGESFELWGKHHEIRLSPQQPYVIWRVRGLG